MIYQIFSPSHLDPLSHIRWMDAMSLAHMWSLDDLFGLCKTTLGSVLFTSSNSKFTPALRLGLANRYKIPNAEWCEAPARQILRNGIKSLSLSEAMQMGEAYMMLARMSENILRQRIAWGMYIPVGDLHMMSVACNAEKHRQMCVPIWKEMWIITVGYRWLRYMDAPILWETKADIIPHLQELRTTTPPEDITTECLDGLINDALDQTDWLGGEEIINTGVSALKELCTG